MKLIGIITPCYNEEKNVETLYERVRATFEQLPQYRYEHLFIDNASTDGTVEVLRRIAQKDKSVKVIVNNRNFGQSRSPYYGLLQSRGDAVISVSADLQDPPELLPDLIKEWENGAKLVAAVKKQSEEHGLVYFLRTVYYRLLNAMTDVELIEHFTGFGLYDKELVDQLRELDDRYPYLRGLVSELGFRAARVPYVQPVRKFGKSSNNLYTLYDLAMLGMTSQSVVPMRLATFSGFFMAFICLLVAAFYLVMKLLYWSDFAIGLAPLVIGVFVMFAIQLIFIGFLGEYIGSIHMHILRRPLVVEKERINFDVAD